MPLTISDLTHEERIDFCGKTIDLWVRRLRAEKKTLIFVPTEEEVQALWDEKVTPDDIRVIEREQL